MFTEYGWTVRTEKAKWQIRRSPAGVQFRQFGSITCGAEAQVLSGIPRGRAVQRNALFLSPFPSTNDSLRHPSIRIPYRTREVSKSTRRLAAGLALDRRRRRRRRRPLALLSLSFFLPSKRSVGRVSVETLATFPEDPAGRDVERTMDADGHFPF